MHSDTSEKERKHSVWQFFTPISQREGCKRILCAGALHRREHLCNEPWRFTQGGLHSGVSELLLCPDVIHGNS